jgi:hypothetical protein
VDVEDDSFGWFCAFLECILDVLDVMLDVALHDLEVFMQEIGGLHRLFLKLLQI